MMDSSTPDRGRTLQRLLQHIGQRLVVSCQAGSDHALRDTSTVVRMARAAEDGGAAAIRCGGVGGAADVAAIAQAVRVPVIGLTKDGTDGVYITPTVRAALSVVESGADVVAADATDRPRPDGAVFGDTVRAVHGAGRLVMADVSTLDEGIAAAEAGADLIATTLSGNIAPQPRPRAPDLDLVAHLRRTLPDIPVVAEGRYYHPRDAAAAVSAGATAVVVGTAITDPTWITSRFAAGLGLAHGDDAVPPER
ncbi:N-acetylmannosamine-6-phosphate 2-epimerase [Salinifilum ghardaiensis]